MAKALILDMDGTMIDSERTIIRLWGDIARELGHMFDDAVMIATVGTTYEATEQAMLSAYPDAPHAQIRAEASRRFHILRDEGNIPLRPGLMNLLDAARERNLPVGVCTSTRRASAEATLAACGILPRIGAMVCAGEAQAGKPDPAPYLLAAHRLGVEPKDCVAVEDSPSGARSALSAGMRVAVVPDLVPVPADVVPRARVLTTLSQAADLLDE